MLYLPFYNLLRFANYAAPGAFVEIFAVTRCRFISLKRHMQPPCLSLALSLLVLLMLICPLLLMDCVAGEVLCHSASRLLA